MRCAKFGVQCIQDPEKPKQCACKRCAGLKEKCEQAEVKTGGSGSSVDKAKTKAVATSQRGGEKQKKVKKTVAVVVDNEIQEVAGPSKSGSRGSGNQAFLDRMDRLVESMGELTREVRWMRQAQCSVARSNNRVGHTLEMFLEECHWFNGPHNKLGTDPESGKEVDPEEIDREVEGLEQEMEKAGDELLSHHAPPCT